MKVTKQIGVAALCGVVMLWTGLACGSPATDNQASGPGPRETEMVRQSPDRRVTEEPAQVAMQPTATPEPKVAGITETPPVPTMTAAAPTMTATQEATPTPRADATRLSDGQVYVAPKKEPTATPLPTPSPTLDAGAEPPTIWNQFTREEYEALIPDPALGIFWGHPFDGHQRRPQNTTPDGIRQNFDLDHAPLEMLHALADKMLDGVSGTGDFGEWNLYRTGYGVKRASTQWEWVHPEMPLARMIIEAEFWTEEWKPRREWEYWNQGQDPETLQGMRGYWGQAVPSIVVWRGGAHFIMKDIHIPPPAQGQVWSTKYEPELIGPVVVEETTCAGMLMPDFRHPTLGALCSR